MRALGGNRGWVVTNTAPGEWIEFDKLDFSAGTYRFIAQHSTSGSSNDDRRIQVLIDDIPLKPIILPPTANADTFLNTLVGEAFVSPGTHNVRVQFMDGLLDFDSLFIRKADSILSLKATSNERFVSALQGGGSTISATATSATGD